MNIRRNGNPKIKFRIHATYKLMMRAYKIPPRYFKYFLFLKKIMQYRAGMFIRTLSRSSGPSGEDRFTKKTPITFPSNPASGYTMQKPTMSSAILNCSPRKLIGWNIYPKTTYSAATMAVIATFLLFIFFIFQFDTSVSYFL